MQRTDKEKEGIMGTVFRMLCGLVVIMLAGASCATGPQTKVTAPTAKPMVVITIDPETGGFTVQDTSGNALKSPVLGQSQVGTLTTSTTPITINVELRPASTSDATYRMMSSATTSTCRIFYVNGVQYCR